MNDIVIYNDGELELNVSVDQESVWLNRSQLSELFDRDIKTIGKHINNIFKDQELDQLAVVAKFATTAADRKTYNVDYYNLDVVISVGYRVKSQKGVHFRQWATKVLTNYIFTGYALNSEKLTQQRLSSLENEIETIKSHIKNNVLELKHGIFFNGQIFDAYVFISDLIKSAKATIVLIDNYIDESILILLAKNSKIQITIYTHTLSEQLQLDTQKYNKQYGNLKIKQCKKFHDRFMIIDDEKVYHIGASLKDLGNKVFAFSQIDIHPNDILKRV